MPDALLDQFRLDIDFHPGYYIQRNQVDGETEEIPWIQCDMLGEGSFGQVWLEREREGSRMRAVKKVWKRKDRTLDFKRELLALTSLSKHTSTVVEFLGFFENPYEPIAVYFAMEYCPLGDLHNYASHYTHQPFTENDARPIVQQVLRGLEVMHALGFAHRDLKPKNILVIQDQPSFLVKIADFGITKKAAMGDDTHLRTKVGTRDYAAPEQFSSLGIDEDIPYTHAVDMWSLGCVTHWMLTRTIPFPSTGLSVLDKYAKDAEVFPSETLSGNGVGPNGIDFIKCLLVMRPEARMSAWQAIEHEWLRNDNTLVNDKV